MKKRFLFLSLILLTLTTTYSQTSLSEAVNIAGKQRMLGQRMAKNKVFLNAHKKQKFASKELQETFTSFQKGLEILNEYAPTKAIKIKIAIQSYAYKQYKEQILDESNQSVKEVFASNTTFLHVCDDLVTEIIKHSETLPDSKKNHSKTIDQIAKATGASGKLRYLTQRLTLYFSINEFGFENVSPLEVNTIIKDLDANLKYLVALDFNTTEINKSLAEITSSWNTLKGNLYSNNKVNMTPKNINAVSLYDLSNAILDKANTATKMYANLNKS